MRRHPSPRLTASRHPLGVVGWLCLLAWLLLHVHSLAGYQPRMLANPDVCSAATRISPGGEAPADGEGTLHPGCDVCCVFAQHQGAALPTLHAVLRLPPPPASVQEARPTHHLRGGPPWPPGQPRAPPALS